MDIGQTVNEHYFRGCRTLEGLRMPFNALETISLGLYHIAKTVKYLKFEHNVIRSVASMEGIAFAKLRLLDLSHNNITHLNTEHLIAPQLRGLGLKHNHLMSLREVTLSSLGNSLPDGEFLNIYLIGNPWNCDGSLSWLQSNLFILARNVRGEEELIHAKPPLKPCIRNVDRLICHSPERRLGTAVVPRGRIAVHKRIKSLKNLAGNRKWHPHYHNYTKYFVLSCSIDVVSILSYPYLTHPGVITDFRHSRCSFHKNRSPGMRALVRFSICYLDDVITHSFPNFKDG